MCFFQRHELHIVLSLMIQEYRMNFAYANVEVLHFQINANSVRAKTSSRSAEIRFSGCSLIMSLKASFS